MAYNKYLFSPQQEDLFVKLLANRREEIKKIDEDGYDLEIEDIEELSLIDHTLRVLNDRLKERRY